MLRFFLTIFLLLFSPVDLPAQWLPTREDPAQKRLDELIWRSQQAVIDSVVANNRAHTLALFRTHCEKYPETISGQLKPLIQTIAHARIQWEFSQKTVIGLEHSHADPIVIGQIVAIALISADNFKESIVNAAILAAPYAEAEIRAVSTKTEIDLQIYLTTPDKTLLFGKP